MKFLTREQVSKFTPEETQEYYEKMQELRRFACAMVKDVSRPAIGKLQSRCVGNASNFVDYESSMFIYLTNAVYRHILGEENLEKARVARYRAQERGKTGVTIPSVLSLEGQVHLKNFYRYIEEKLVDDPKLRFKSDREIQDFLRETRKAYAEDHCVNFGFTGRTSDCTAHSEVAKPINSLDKLIAVGRPSKTKEYPVFDEYTIKSMEINEYLLSRAKAMYVNPLYIKAMEDTLQTERLDIVENADKGDAVKRFYEGSVSEVLAKMKAENEKAKLIESVKNKKGKSSKTNTNLTESETLEYSGFGGDHIVADIKDALIRRNSVGVELITLKPNEEGFLKDNTAELKPAKTVQLNLLSASKKVATSEAGKQSDEQETNEKRYRDEMYLLRYKLASGRIDQDEYEEEVEKLRYKGMATSHDCPDAVFESSADECKFTTDEEENIIEDEYGQIKLF